jgi:hypothetical protein
VAEPLEKKISRENHIASDWLLWVDEWEVDLLERREEILDSSSSGRVNAAGITVVGPGQKASLRPGHTWQVPNVGTHPSSDITGNKGSVLAELNKKERWISLIREVENTLTNDRRLFLMLRRDCRHNVGRRGWITYVYDNYTFQTKTKVSRSTLCERWEMIVSYAAREACKRGLL